MFESKKILFTLPDRLEIFDTNTNDLKIIFKSKSKIGSSIWSSDGKFIILSEFDAESNRYQIKTLKFGTSNENILELVRNQNGEIIEGELLNMTTE